MGVLTLVLGAALLLWSHVSHPPKLLPAVSSSGRASCRRCACNRAASAGCRVPCDACRSSGSPSFSSPWQVGGCFRHGCCMSGRPGTSEQAAAQVPNLLCCLLAHLFHCSGSSCRGTWWSRMRIRTCEAEQHAGRDVLRRSDAALPAKVSVHACMCAPNSCVIVFYDFPRPLGVKQLGRL